MGVVLVTHNSERFVAQTWQSILDQDHPIARIAVIDDHSRDNTLSLLEELVASASTYSDIDITIENATTAAPNSTTRIAQNFVQGVRVLRDCEVIALGDHDDTWYQDRITRQVSFLRTHPETLMLASNGDLSSTGTLFENFEVPAGFNQLSPPEQLRHVLRRSVATGGASMLRVTDWLEHSSFIPPRGWLHDRWWSIVAASQSGLAIDTAPVIEYRVSEGQQVGLDHGRQTSHTLSRVRRSSVSDGAKLRELHDLRGVSTPECSSVLSWPSLIYTLLT